MQQFEDVVQYLSGAAQPGVVVTVKLNGSAAVIWADAQGAVPTNPVTSNSQGLISFFYSEGGVYSFWVSGESVFSIDLPIPVRADEAQGLTAPQKSTAITNIGLDSADIGTVLTAWFNALPTSLPGAAGVLWNNGGVLSQS